MYFIFMQVVNYNYGKADKNPIDHVRFYKKGDPTVAIHVRKDDVCIHANSQFFVFLKYFSNDDLFSKFIFPPCSFRCHACCLRCLLSRKFACM